MHLSVVPLYWRRRLEILLHNLLGRSPAGWLQVKRAGPLVHLSIGGEHITITSIGRWKRYRRGISARLEAVAARYGAVELRDRIKGGNVIDIGANVGEFSRLASERGIPTIAFDIDPAAVERNYLACREKSETNLLPLLMDLTNPSPDLGWQNQERMSLISRAPAGAVLALALIHHLAIGNNVPLPDLADFFHRLGKWLVIEFVPKDDSQVQRLLATREDIFTSYDVQTFSKVFAERFDILESIPINDSPRTLYLMQAKGE